MCYQPLINSHQGQSDYVACAQPLQLQGSAKGFTVTCENGRVDENSETTVAFIGKGGSMLKRIGAEARQDIAQMTGATVYLKLFVRVQKNWRKDTKAIERFGY